MDMRAQFVIPVIVSIILIGTITTGIVVFAEQPTKTLAEECAKKENSNDFDSLFCLAIQSLDAQFDELFVQKDLDTPVLFLQVDPNSQAPALVVNDGTNDVFIVNKDGSIQIGSSTVVLNPDGSVTGGPLFLEAGSTVDGNLIVAPSSPCENKDIAQLKGGDWKCTKPENIGAPSGGVTEGTEVVVLDHSGFTGTSSTVGNQMAGAEFTMPTVANAYIISAIEVRSGTTIVPASYPCAVVIRPTGDDSFPIVTAGDWVANIIVASARGGINTSTGASDIATSTTFKMKATSMIVSGGEKLAVLFDSCNNSTTEFDGATRTEIWSGASFNIICCSEDGLGSQNRLQFTAETNNYYIKVYAKPI